MAFEATSQTIVFDNDNINEGGHYNVTTGIFTAPVTGIYQFFAYINSSPKASWGLSRGGSTYINPRENYNDEPEPEAEGASVIMRLQAGQTVYVLTGSEPYTVMGDSNGVLTWFGGYLLFPDEE